MGKRYSSSTEKEHIEKDIDPRIAEKNIDKTGYFKAAISSINEAHLRTGLKVALFLILAESIFGGCGRMCSQVFSENKTNIQQQITTAPNQQPPASKP